MQPERKHADPGKRKGFSMSEYVSKHARTDEKVKKKGGFFRSLLKLIGILILVVVLLVGGMIGFLSITEYKPVEREAVAFEGEASGKLAAGEPFSVMTWNIGYGALGDNADFFMDGGTMVRTADEERVKSNMDSITSGILEDAADVVFLQETDRDSSRSCHMNEYSMLKEAMTGYTSGFASNFKVAFLPYPVPPIGKVDSGIATFSSYPVSGAERIQLPIPFKWPVRMANLKRCVLVSRVPVEGSDKELVLFNLHLEAYDDGQGKAAQTRMLAELLEEEAEKGNYVIAGGDFNQIFSSADTDAFPMKEGLWQAGEINVSEFEGKWQFIMDEKVPSCRSLDQKYEGADPDTFQYYLIDGFIVSDNIKVNSAGTEDRGFISSDHNPVLMEVVLDAETGEE